MSSRQCAVLASAALALGCATGRLPVTAHPVTTTASTHPVATAPVATTLLVSPKPLVVPQTGLPATVAGDCRVLVSGTFSTQIGNEYFSDLGSGLITRARLISDNGGGVISNNGSGIISNNGGSIISDNGGGILTDAGGGLITRARYGLMAATTPGEYALSDAVILVYDAANEPVVDGAGKPLTATTDAQGHYTLTAVLPKTNLVLRVKLFPGSSTTKTGGELAAMLPQQDGSQLTQPISMATTLGASYVLDTLVKGDTAVYNRLPASESEQLRLQFQAATRLITQAPTYQPTVLQGLTATLRQQVKPLDSELDNVKALLLGQSKLGAGLPATSVPLDAPESLALDPQGNLLIGEYLWGRIRRLEADGTLATFADLIFGELKRNFPFLGDMATAADGSLYVLTRTNVVHIGLDGQAADFAGNGTAAHATPGGPALQTALLPSTLATAPDGTVYVCEGRNQDDVDQHQPTHVVAIGPDGVVQAVPLDPTWGPGIVVRLLVEPDGSLDVLFVAQAEPPVGKLYHYRPGTTATLLAANLQTGLTAGLARAADGTLYVAEDQADRVSAIAPNGQAHIVAGVGAPSGAQELSQPRALVVAKDGTLFVSDVGANLVRALATDGSWRVRAGTAATTQLGDGGALAINSPGGSVFDSQGRLVIAEGGSQTIVRYDGHTLTTIAGTTVGFSCDGGPATAASFNFPHTLAVQGDNLFVLDSNNGCIRKIGADGNISTVVGARGASDKLVKGTPVAPGQVFIKDGQGLALDATGRIYWTNTVANQIQRLSADGSQVELVAGIAGSVPGGTGGDGGPASDASLYLPAGLAFDPQGDLFVADTGGMRIRKLTGLAGANPTITTFAGQPLEETLARAKVFDRNEEGIDALQATMFAPGALCFDPAGDMFVSEAGTVATDEFGASVGAASSFAALGFPKVAARIRKITPDGRITTLAGPGGLYFTDPTAPDALSQPGGLVIDPAGRLVITDEGTNQVRFLPAGSF